MVMIKDEPVVCQYQFAWVRSGQGPDNITTSGQGDVRCQVILPYTCVVIYLTQTDHSDAYKFANS